VVADSQYESLVVEIGNQEQGLDSKNHHFLPFCGGVLAKFLVPKLILRLKTYG
jgi:hypothetical protein